MKLQLKFEGVDIKNVKDEIEGPEDEKKSVLQLHLSGDTDKSALPALFGCFEGQDVDYLYMPSAEDSNHLIPRMPFLSTMNLNGVHDKCTVNILKDTYEECRVQNAKVTLLEAGRARINFNLTIPNFTPKQAITLLNTKKTTLPIVISGGIALFEDEKPKNTKQKTIFEPMEQDEELTDEEQQELTGDAVAQFESTLETLN